MFVARARYDAMTRRAEHAEAQVAAVQALYASLLDKYHALKLLGATPSRPAPKAIAPPPTPEERLLHEADEAYEQNAVKALVSQGATELEARTIAKQMRAELLNLSVALPGYDG